MEENDRIYQRYLPRLFPQLGKLSLYLTANKIKRRKSFKKEVLKKRLGHYIFFGNKILLNPF